MAADNVPVTPGAGASIATDDVGGVQFQKVKVDAGGDGVSVPVIAGQQLAAASVPVVLASDKSVTVVQATATNLKVDASGVAVPVTDNGGNISIDDGGNSITVDYATTGSGTAAGALRVELPTNGTGVLATLGTITNVVHVDDNAASLTVDNAGTFAVQAAQSGTWTVTINADALTYTPVGSETGLVVRPLAGREELQLVRQMEVIAEEIRMLRRVFLDWSGMGEPRQVYSDNVNLVQ